MSGPHYIVFGPPRSGTTALYRVLNLIPGVRTAYEPAFHEVPLTPSGVASRVRGLLRTFSGFKHVFDPSGFPFRAEHDAKIAEMERDRLLWIRLNLAILNAPGLRIVFLRRRNGFERVVSDLVGRATNLWGHSGEAMTEKDVFRYKTAISRCALPPLDEELVAWYLQHLPSYEADLRGGIAPGKDVLDIWYEDIFGTDVGMPDRIWQLQEILRFLRLQVPDGYFQWPALSLVLEPAAKLNDEQIFSRIPNYRSLSEKWGLRRQSA